MSPRSGSSPLAGNRIPRRHRFYLSDGRVMIGDLYRSPNSRLADHVASLKGYISVVDATIEHNPNAVDAGDSNLTMGFIALNCEHIMFIEELEADGE